ncbi:hypothetical protein KAJ83_10360 [Marivibrio halodurans]|uniref:Uncharacterized protein n=1 Tax=Marivibrio halodurans TaxID=2039722 RepID=A0A8J7S020_9PROT|nr:hypothetical protein [Marivibrio halodurans]MBP5857410.1 hypothetical protein [Marivibrio halodurans]
MRDKHDTDHFNAKATDGAADPPASSAYPALEFDASEFMHFLDDADWSEEEKAEYITLVWNIVCEFVALGFNMHPLQQTQNSCGKPGDQGLRPPPDSESGVESLRAYLQENHPEPRAATEDSRAEREET